VTSIGETDGVVGSLNDEQCHRAKKRPRDEVEEVASDCLKSSAGSEMDVAAPSVQKVSAKGT
jgi:hypothetical protein